MSERRKSVAVAVNEWQYEDALLTAEGLEMASPELREAWEKFRPEWIEANVRAIEAGAESDRLASLRPPDDPWLSWLPAEDFATLVRLRQRLQEPKHVPTQRFEAWVVWLRRQWAGPPRRQAGASRMDAVMIKALDGEHPLVVSDSIGVLKPVLQAAVSRALRQFEAFMSA